MTQSDIVQKIFDVIGSKLTNKDELHIGVEIENIVYDKYYQRIPVNKDAEISALDIKDKLNSKNKKSYIHPNLTIEPGGQIEYSSQPYLDIHQINQEWMSHQQNFFELCYENNLTPLDFSLEPVYAPEEIIIIDQKKYHLMHDQFAGTGTLGHWMMKNTTSIQVNFDYTSLEEAERLAYISDCIQPFIAMIFANSPFINGKPTANRNLRAEIWQDTDPSRCGSLLEHNLLNERNLLESYADYLLQTPAIFILDKAGNPDSFDGTLGEWLNSLNRQKILKDSDALAALHQIFTHVRFKQIIELRGSDRPPFGYELAPVAFLTGLLRVPQIADQLFNIVSAWTPEERKDALRKSSILDLQTIFSGKTMVRWIEILFEMALKGLDLRAEELKIKNERIFLESFVELYLAKGPFSLQIQAKFQSSGKSLETFIRDRWLCQHEKHQE